MKKVINLVLLISVSMVLAIVALVNSIVLIVCAPYLLLCTGSTLALPRHEIVREYLRNDLEFNSLLYDILFKFWRHK